MNDIDYYIKCDDAGKTAYDLGDLIRELPYRKRQGSTESTIANIKAHITKLTELLNTIVKE